MGGSYSIKLHITEDQESIDVDFKCKDSMTIQELKSAIAKDSEL